MKLDDAKDTLDDPSGSQQLPIPSYLLEIAKSGRAECKRYETRIANKEVGKLLRKLMTVIPRSFVLLSSN